MSESEYIVIVDENDNELGVEEKNKCHDGHGILHRAFTLMLKNSKGEYLVTKRSDKKRLWPGIWDNSISSHVWKGESYEDAAKRRLPDELGVKTDDVKLIFKIRYRATYKNEGSENEIDAFLVAEGIDKISPNKDEISDYEFLSYEKLKEDVKNNPDKYAPWSLIIFEKLFDMNG